MIPLTFILYHLPLRIHQVNVLIFIRLQIYKDKSNIHILFVKQIWRINSRVLVYILCAPPSRDVCMQPNKRETFKTNNTAIVKVPTKITLVVIYVYKEDKQIQPLIKYALVWRDKCLNLYTFLVMYDLIFVSAFTFCHSIIHICVILFHMSKIGRARI